MMSTIEILVTYQLSYVNNTGFLVFYEVLVNFFQSWKKSFFFLVVEGVFKLTPPPLVVRPKKHFFMSVFPNLESVNSLLPVDGDEAVEHAYGDPGPPDVPRPHHVPGPHDVPGRGI